MSLLAFLADTLLGLRCPDCYTRTRNLAAHRHLQHAGDRRE